MTSLIVDWPSVDIKFKLDVAWYSNGWKWRTFEQFDQSAWFARLFQDTPIRQLTIQHVWDAVRGHHRQLYSTISIRHELQNVHNVEYFPEMDHPSGIFQSIACIFNCSSSSNATKEISTACDYDRIISSPFVADKSTDVPSCFLISLKNIDEFNQKFMNFIPRRWSIPSMIQLSSFTWIINNNYLILCCFIWYSSFIVVSTTSIVIIVIIVIKMLRIFQIGKWLIIFSIIYLFSTM